MLTMRYTNVRTFHKHFFEEVKDLPVTVTKYGKPIFTVNKYGRAEIVPERFETREATFKPTVYEEIEDAP